MSSEANEVTEDEDFIVDVDIDSNDDDPSDGAAAAAGAADESNASGTDDDLQKLLDEAENLMQGINTDDGGTSDVYDGFSIDSDIEEDDDHNHNHNHNQNLRSAPKTQNPNGGLGKNAGSGSNGNGSSTVPDLDHPLSEEWLSTPTTPGSAPSPSASEATAITGMAGQPALSSATMDSFKQQTSRFASNLATIAQRAANQVAAVTAVQPVAVQGGPTAHQLQHQQMLMQQSMAQTRMPQTPQQFQPQMQNLQQRSYQNQSNNSTPIPYGYNVASTPAKDKNGASAQAEMDKEQKLKLLKDTVGDLLPGERTIMFLSNLLHVSSTSGVSYIATQSSDRHMWCCAMSYYRLILFSTASKEQSSLPCPKGWNNKCWPDMSSAQRVIEVPLASIERVEKGVYQTMGSSFMGLIIRSKDCGLEVRFTTPSYADTGRVLDSLNTYSFPGKNQLGYLFAFESKRQKVISSIKTDEASGRQEITLAATRKRFDGMIEFPRLLKLSETDQRSPWTLWASVNSSYQLSSSYPSILVGPASLDETKPETAHVIQQCAAFRSEYRLPTMTWCGAGGASIWRASQPKVGLQGNRSPADELFLRHIMESARGANAMSKPPTVYSRKMLQQLTGDFTRDWTPEQGCGLKIMDLRPRSSAMANRTGGYGYENTSNYANTTLQFCNIGNIHAVRDSYNKLCGVCNSDFTLDANWGPLVEDSKWLSHIRLILAASWETAYWVHVWRLPVLVHCSHGWDRTSQVAALAQLLLDPYYRTREGFSVLVEKDFMSFGHPFHTRCAHGEGRSDSTAASAQTSSKDEGQISPIFLQFLDCVYQIVHLFPACFEFNTKYLLEFSFHIYSCRFGSLLCDSERERELLAGIRQRTYSIWDYLDSLPGTKNEEFDVESNEGVLLMPLPTLLRGISLWTERHCRHSPKPTLGTHGGTFL